MTTKTPQPARTDLRPLELDPERVTRSARPPYAIVDIGSNSVRLMVYDQLGRAPMPRFNEKSLLPARRRPGAETGRDFARRLSASRPGGAPVSRHCRRDGRNPDRRDRDRGDAPRLQWIGSRGGDRGGKRAQSSHPHRGKKRRVTRRSASSRGSFDPWGWSAIWAAAASRSRRRSMITSEAAWVSLPLGALPVEAMLAEGVAVGQAPRRRHPAGGPQVRAGAGRCSIRSAAAGARLPRPTSSWSTLRSRSFTATNWTASVARDFAQFVLRLLAGQARRDSGRRGAAGANAAGGGDGAGPCAEAPRAGAGRLFRPGIARGPASIRSSQGGAISRSPARGRATHWTAAGAGAGFRSGACVMDGRSLSGRDLMPKPACGWRLARFRISPGGTRRT